MSMYVNGTCHDATADVAVAVVAGVRSYWLGRMTKDQKRRLRRVEGVQNSGSGPKEFASGSGRRLTSDERRATGDGRRRRTIRFHACLPSRGGRTEDRGQQHSDADGWVIDSLKDPGSIPQVFRADNRT